MILFGIVECIQYKQKAPACTYCTRMGALVFNQTRLKKLLHLTNAKSDLIDVNTPLGDVTLQTVNDKIFCESVLGYFVFALLTIYFCKFLI